MWPVRMQLNSIAVNMQPSIFRLSAILDDHWRICDHKIKYLTTYLVMATTILVGFGHSTRTNYWYFGEVITASRQQELNIVSQSPNSIQIFKKSYRYSVRTMIPVTPQYSRSYSRQRFHQAVFLTLFEVSSQPLTLLKLKSALSVLLDLQEHTPWRIRP